jgi:hypothetical protein
MRPAQGEVLHFSEDPNILRFEPHVAATARQPEAYVWAVDHERAPDYWFPRQCPRAMAWTVPTTAETDRVAILGPGGGTRVHAVEYDWLPAMMSVKLFAYRFSAKAFRPIGEPVSHALVATETVTPLGPAEPVGDLMALHSEGGIQLKVLNNIRPFWNAVTNSTLGFSAIRVHNARK